MSETSGEFCGKTAHSGEQESSALEGGRNEQWFYQLILHLDHPGKVWFTMGTSYNGNQLVCFIGSGTTDHLHYPNSPERRPAVWHLLTVFWCFELLLFLCLWSNHHRVTGKLHSATLREDDSNHFRDPQCRMVLNRMIHAVRKVHLGFVWHRLANSVATWYPLDPLPLWSHGGKSRHIMESLHQKDHTFCFNV